MGKFGEDHAVISVSNATHGSKAKTLMGLLGRVARTEHLLQNFLLQLTRIADTDEIISPTEKNQQLDGATAVGVLQLVNGVLQKVANDCIDFIPLSSSALRIRILP